MLAKELLWMSSFNNFFLFITCPRVLGLQVHLGFVQQGVSIVKGTLIMNSLSVN